MVVQSQSILASQKIIPNAPNKTTKCWEVLIERKYEIPTWVDIKYVKEASLIKMSEYAVTNQIAENPVFAWWVPYTLKKSNRIISKIQAKNWRTTQNFGARMAKNGTESMHIYP